MFVDRKARPSPSFHQVGEREPLGRAEPGLKQALGLYFCIHPQLHIWEFSVKCKKDSQKWLFVALL